MQRPSWNAYSFFTSEGSDCKLWGLKMQCLIHNSQPLVSILSQTIRSTPCFNTCFNIILPYIRKASECSLSLRFPHHNPSRTSPPTRVTHPAHPLILDLTTALKTFGEQYGSVHSFHTPVIFLPLRPKYHQHPILNTLSAYVSPLRERSGQLALTI